MGALRSAVARSGRGALVTLRVEVAGDSLRVQRRCEACGHEATIKRRRPLVSALRAFAVDVDAVLLIALAELGCTHARPLVVSLSTSLGAIIR